MFFPLFFKDLIHTCPSKISFNASCSSSQFPVASRFIAPLPLPKASRASKISIRTAESREVLKLKEIICKLGGGFTYFVFSPLFWEMIQFDCMIFSNGLKPPTSKGLC